jgi:hypothetical protein
MAGRSPAFGMAPEVFTALPDSGAVAEIATEPTA